MTSKIKLDNNWKIVASNASVFIQNIGSTEIEVCVLPDNIVPIDHGFVLDKGNVFSIKTKEFVWAKSKNDFGTIVINIDDNETEDEDNEEPIVNDTLFATSNDIVYDKLEVPDNKNAMLINPVYFNELVIGNNSTLTLIGV